MGVIASRSKSKREEKDQNESQLDLIPEIADVPIINNSEEHETEQKKEIIEEAKVKPISEAEKNLHLYKQRITSGYENLNKKDGKKQKYRKQYKTSDYHDSGKCTPPMINKDTQRDMAFIKQGLLDKPRIQPINASLTRVNQVQSYNLDVPSRPVSISTNSLTKHEVSLTSVENVIPPPKQFAHKHYSTEKNTKHQLESRGLLVPDAFDVSMLRETRQEGIFGELREVGLIKKNQSESEGHYSLSCGLPRRRPPPRSTLLPPLPRDSSKVKDTEFQEVELKKAPEDSTVFFGKIGEEKVGDAARLKVKMLDLDTC